MPFAYIASPYTHEDPDVRQDRYIEVCTFTRWVALEVKLTPYSPIVHFHEIAKMHQLPYDAAFWEKINHDMLAEAHTLYVLGIDGWKESKGIAGEMRFAVKKHKTIVLAEPQFVENVEPPHYHITPLKYKL